MPAAHAFLQVRAEIPQFLDGLSTDQIWARPGQSASIGYHAIHLAGATDRLMTYARGEQLTEAQLADVRTTEKTVTGLEADAIVRRVHDAVDAALAQVRATPVDSLTAERTVGRKHLPSTTLGLDLPRGRARHTPRGSDCDAASGDHVGLVGLVGRSGGSRNVRALARIRSLPPGRHSRAEITPISNFVPSKMS